MFNLEKMCIFATAYARKVSIARKALRNCPFTEIRQYYEGGRSILLSLVVYAISQRHTLRREICSMEKPDGFTRS